MNEKRQSKDSYMKGNLMRRKILSLCYELGWTCGNNVDFLKLNQWLIKYSYLHKPLNYYTPDELPKLITQFQDTVAKIIIKKTSKK